MNLYLVDYWIPFPSSEYGGIAVFAAEHEDQIVELAMEMMHEYDIEDYGWDVLTNNVKRGIRHIGTTNKYPKPCVVESFFT
jgi:hypothetical protein